MEYPIVKVYQGLLRGINKRNINGVNFAAFRGIPYAKPPVGKLRFKSWNQVFIKRESGYWKLTHERLFFLIELLEIKQYNEWVDYGLPYEWVANLNGFSAVHLWLPALVDNAFQESEPLERWSGVRNAFNFGSRCAQVDWITQRIIGGDDCLYLNIYTPTLSPSQPQAVMVWIHGGAFNYGSGDDDFYGPDFLIEEDVVLVTINYRLGILGFLNVGNEEAPGNQGLKDQVLALKWIQQNIAEFGGDPKNVTIFGWSAGAASVHYLATSPLGKGLFHKAIMQSGNALNSWASSPVGPIEPVQKLAEILNKDMSNLKLFVDYLRELDAQHLVEIVNQVRTREDEILLIYPFIPTVDSKAPNPFLTRPIEDMSKAGINVPCICGSTSHEGIFTIGGMDSDMFDEIDANPEHLLIHPNTLRFLKKNSVTAIDMKRFYFGDQKYSSENIDRIVDLLSDVHCTIGLHNFLEIQSKIVNLPTYFYKFEYEVHDSLIKQYFRLNHVKGTPHGEELGFLFLQKLPKLLGKQLPERDSVEHDLIQRFTKLWTNFAKTGNPTPCRTDLIPIMWEPVDNPDEYKCLNITDQLNIGSEKNIVRRLSEFKTGK